MDKGGAVGFFCGGAKSASCLVCSSSAIDQRGDRSASVGTWVFKVGAEPPRRSIRPSAPYPSWRETPGGFAREGSQTRAWGRAHSRGGRSFVIQPGRLSPRGEQSLVTAAGRTRAEYRSAREGSPGWGGRHDVARELVPRVVFERGARLGPASASPPRRMLALGDDGRPEVFFAIVRAVERRGQRRGLGLRQVDAGRVRRLIHERVQATSEACG